MRWRYEPRTLIHHFYEFMHIKCSRNVVLNRKTLLFLFSFKNVLRRIFYFIVGFVKPLDHSLDRYFWHPNLWVNSKVLGREYQILSQSPHLTWFCNICSIHWKRCEKKNTMQVFSHELISVKLLQFTTGSILGIYCVVVVVVNWHDLACMKCARESNQNQVDDEFSENSWWSLCVASLRTPLK